MKKIKKCVYCNSKMIRVIYLGLPIWLCEDDTCNCVDGFWSRLIDFIDPIFPFNGKYMSYTGSYWTALWSWLFD